MARKTDHELDCKLAHELEVARYLAAAFIAQNHVLGWITLANKYAHMPVS